MLSILRVTGGCSLCRHVLGYWQVHTLDILSVCRTANTYRQANTFALTFTATGNFEFLVHQSWTRAPRGNPHRRGGRCKLHTESPPQSAWLASHPGPSFHKAIVASAYKPKNRKSLLHENTSEINELASLRLLRKSQGAETLLIFGSVAAKAKELRVVTVLLEDMNS